MGTTTGAGSMDLAFSTRSGATFGERIRIAAAGNVGIGTTSPQAQLVVSNAGAQGVEITGSTGSFQVYNRSTSAYGTANIYANTFYVRTGASPAINVAVDVNGLVGIGITSPSARLDVRSGATATSAWFTSTDTTAYSPTTSASVLNARLHLFGGAATSAYTSIRFSQSGSAEALFGAVQNASGTLDFILQGYNGTAYAERARLDASGRLLIGTASASGIVLKPLCEGVPERGSAFRTRGIYTSGISLGGRLAISRKYCSSLSSGVIAPLAVSF